MSLIKTAFNPSNRYSINSKLRLKRFQLFIQLLKNYNANGDIRILDIGGTQSFWERMNFVEIEGVHITLLNLDIEEVKYKNISSIKGCAFDLSNIKDKEYDIVFSNSVIEHLFNADNQKKMADEVRRVGKTYFIQTPYYYFPIEPHWLLPFFQFMPFKAKLFLTRNIAIGRHSKERDIAIQLINEVRLLKKKDMKAFFPDGNIFSEKLVGITKSITMYKFN